MVEKPTGNLTFGAGFSSTEKLALSASIKQENFFGSGNYLGIEVNTSKYNRTPGAQHGRSVLHGRRRLARLRHLLPHLAGRSTAWATVPDRNAGRGDPLRRAVLRVRHRVLRRRRRDAPRSRPTTALPACSYFDLPRRAIGATSSSRAADDRLGARQPRQRAGADRGPLPARQPRSGRLAGDVQLPAHATPVPAVHPAHHASTRWRSTASSATATAWAASRTRCSRTSTPAASARCAASSRARSGVDGPDRRLHRRRQAAQRQRRAVLPVPGHRQRQTLRIFAFADAGNVWREDEKIDARRPARFGRRRPDLDLAGRPAEAELGKPDRRASPTIESSEFQFQIGTGF